MSFRKDLNLQIGGLGMIIYSEFAVAHIPEGADYFIYNYQTPEQVQAHAINGTIVGFCTSSPGSYILKIRQGYPEDITSYEFQLRLGINVKGRVFVRDLYDLTKWEYNCPESQEIELDNGFYHITLCGNVPDSGILGDNQVIYMYFNKLDNRPLLKYDGVPMFCW